MGKLTKRISAVVAAAVMSATVALSASAATAQDVTATAKAYGASDSNVALINNLITERSANLKSSDFDSMIAAMNNAYTTIVQPITGLSIAEFQALSEAQKLALITSLPHDAKQALFNAADAEANKYGIDLISATKNADGTYTISLTDDKGNKLAQGSTGNTALNTGAGSVTLEVSAALALALAAVGTAVASNKNRKSVM